MSWCNFQDLSTYVKKINFKLHESYPNPNRGMFCLDVYLFMFDLNWFYLDLVLWVLSSCMNEIASLKKCVRKCLMDVNIVLYYCLCLCEKGLATLISFFFYFSACQTSLWSYRDWLGWIWSGHQNIFQWSQWKTGKIFFWICYVPYAIIIDWCFF